MKKSPYLLIFTLLLLAGILVACGAKASPTGVFQPQEMKPAPTSLPVTAAPLAAPPLQGADANQEAGGADAMDVAAASLNVNNRMIIKDAQIKLLVADTDIAIDRTTQIIADVGGYIISSRTWYETKQLQNYKYSTITFGVPVDQFERALSRLRGLSIRVLDEVATGEDVTDQFVDLESQLRNLEATRDRIRTFLDQAKTVEEALEVNAQLTEIEKQIEEIKGRMNYLAGRAAYSTITVTFEPDIPPVTPSPTATATFTPTPTMTATPVQWKPGETFDHAANVLVKSYQGIVDFLIWILVVVVPIIGPPILVIWFIWWLLFRRGRRHSPPGGGAKAG